MDVLSRHRPHCPMVLGGQAAQVLGNKAGEDDWDELVQV